MKSKKIKKKLKKCFKMPINIKNLVQTTLGRVVSKRDRRILMEISNNSSVESLDSIQNQIKDNSQSQRKNLREQTELVKEKQQEQDSVEIRSQEYREQQESIETDEAQARQQFDDDLQTGRNVDFTA